MVFRLSVLAAMIVVISMGELVQAQEISFSQARILAMEGMGIVPVAIPLQRTGGTAGTAFALIRVCMHMYLLAFITC